MVMYTILFFFLSHNYGIICLHPSKCFLKIYYTAMCSLFCLSQDHKLYQGKDLDHGCFSLYPQYLENPWDLVGA